MVVLDQELCEVFFWPCRVCEVKFLYENSYLWYLVPCNLVTVALSPFCRQAKYGPHAAPRG